jgi:hypothetical protein
MNAIHKLYPTKFFPAEAARLAAWVAVIAAVGLMSPLAPAQTPDYQHTVKPGDTLEALARTLMEEPRRYPEVARHNKMGNQDQLKPGQTVLFPVQYLKMRPMDATVTAVKGAATLNGQSVGPGTKFTGRGDVATGQDGQMTIRLADGSEIRVQTNSKLNLSELKSNEAAGTRSARLDLKEGRLETDVTPNKGSSSRFEVKTPVAVTGVRGTSFRVASEAANAKTEVLEGAVATSTPLGSVGVNQGFGTRADAGQPPAPPKELLAAPALTPLPPIVESNSPTLEVARVNGAARYRAMVALDERFERIVAEGVSDAPALRVAALADGEYFFRARAIDPAGLEGINANGKFRVKANPRAPEIDAPAPPANLVNAERIELNFSWRRVAEALGGYRLEIADNAAFNNPQSFAVAETNLTVAFAAAPRRQVFWRVQSLDVTGQPGPRGATQGFLLGRE